MKKVAVFLVVLGLLAAALPVVANDMTVSDTFVVFANYDWAADPIVAASSFVKARIGFDFKPDDFNEIFFQFKGDGAVGTPPDVLFRQAWLKTDLGAAFKLPFGLKTTVGYFDTYFTNWSYVSMSGWEFYYNWPNKLVNQSQNANGAFQADVSVGPVNLHWWNDMRYVNGMFGADVAFGPVTAYLAYGTALADLAGGDLSVEAKYSGKFGDLSLAVPAFFRYGLGDKAFTYGGGVGADYKMFHLAAGLEGDNDNALDNIVADVSVVPMEGLWFGVSLYMDLAATNPFSGAVIEVRKKIGALEAVLGYALCGDGVTSLPTYNDTYGAKGLFAGLSISY